MLLGVHGEVSAFREVLAHEAVTKHHFLNPRRLEGISVEELADDCMKLFISATHPLALKTRFRAQRLLDFPFILPPQGSATRDTLGRITSGVPSRSYHTRV